ncbi:BTB POZ domain-containing protein [Rutstroemia sp. NJR-2017a BVV2]|nr:BTB POZ domain-containing protein [Rutstroemia sp. NJR-2017a BVV2]
MDFESFDIRYNNLHYESNTFATMAPVEKTPEKVKIQKKESKEKIEEAEKQRAEAVSLKRSREESPDFLETVGTEFVELFVGPDKKISASTKVFFVTSLKLPYFAKMFNGGFKEGQDLKASFPEDTPQSFDVLLGWIYFGKIRRISTKAAPKLEVWDAFDVYCLGDKLCIQEFMDSVIDIYINWLATSRIILRPEEISDGFEKIPRGSPFQRLLCHMLHFTVTAYRFANLFEIFPIQDVHKVLGSNEDLRLDLLNRMMLHPPGTIVEDPRKLEKCKFHQHGENEPSMASSASTVVESQDFLQRFGFEIVDLHVGPASKGKLFKVHKKLLCDKIPYFSKMFMSGFAEAKNNYASFPEDSVEAFDLLIEWVYTGVFPKVENWNFLSFYTLAEKLCLPQLQDTAMDMLRTSQHASRLILTLSLITDAYQNTQQGSGYRLYALHSLLYILCLPGDKALEGWNNKDIVEMLKKSSPDLNMDYMTMIRTHFRQTPLKKPVDPRIGDACVYHSHKIDKQCLLKPKLVEAEAKVAPRFQREENIS